jgi:HEAT repeat protein
MYLDLDGLVADGTLSDLIVYGNCYRPIQVKTIQDMLWMSRQTKTQVAALTSGPADPSWGALETQGMRVIFSVGEDEMYLARGGVAEQPLESLKSDKALFRMKALTEIIHGKLKASAGDVEPLVKDSNLIVRRLALQALGVLKDPASVPTIEAALKDPEPAVRYYAMVALRSVHGAESVGKMLKAVADWPHHPLVELAVSSLSRMRPAPVDQLVAAMKNDAHERVREVAARALEPLANDALLPAFVDGLKDSQEYVRFACVGALGHLSRNPAAVEALLGQLDRADDVVVNNRAATALAEIIRRNDPAVAALRPKVLAALGKAYQRLGDGCSREDADWGYRPVGNAILAFGDEGEAVLRRFMLQRKDVRLAEQAWKSLCVRKEMARFDLVTEEENRRDFAQRPPSLHKYAVTRIGQDFEDAALFKPSVTGMVGRQDKALGRWGAFSANGPGIDAQVAHSGKQSLKLVRGKPSITVAVSRGVRDQANARLSVWVYRDGDSSAVTVNGYGAGRGGVMGFYIDPAGILRLRDAKKDGWAATKLKVPARQWAQVQLTSDGPLGNYGAAVVMNDKTQTSDVRAALPKETEIKRVEFSPQGEAGTAVHMDDLELVGMP